MNAAEKQELFARVVASKQAVRTYAVLLDDGQLVSLELSEAQVEGFECMTCKTLCTSGLGAFRPAGRVLNVGTVFQCVACTGGAR